MSITRTCPDTLISRARSGRLAPSEQLQLDAHLERCASCRTVLLLGGDLDEVLMARSGDERTAMQIADRIDLELDRAIVSKARIFGRRTSRLWFLAAALVTFSVVAATRQSWRPKLNSPPPRMLQGLPTIHVVPVVGAVQREASADAPALTANVPAIDSPPDDQHLSIARHEPSRRAHSRRPDDATSSDAPTAAVLFADANTARRSAHDVVARGLYQQLQQSYPNSVEAAVSRVSLGRLLLDPLHDPRAALAQFDSYLAQHSHTALREDALFGRANALTRLGRRVDERSAWQALLDGFPHSVYSSRARSRLQSLSDGEVGNGQTH